MAFGMSFSSALAAAACPLDHVVFVDQASGRSFVAQKVAMELVYRCARIHRAIRPQPRLEGRLDCRGPFGSTIVQGSLGKAVVYAVFSVEDGAPCCRWDSFGANDRAVSGRKYTWLTGRDRPLVELGSEQYTIASSGTLDPMRGPLAGGNYVPDQCRGQGEDH